MRTFKTKGIVIRRRNYNEADRMVTVFSEKNGKIIIKAGGVRKITSRRSPHIELLNHSLFNLYKGKGMPVLTEIESIENFSQIKEDLRKVGVAYHLCELVDSLCAENQENPEIYYLLLRTLNKLTKEDDLRKLSYEFEVELLRLLGFYKFSQSLEIENTQGIIEEILERKLKTKRMLSQFF